MATENNLDVVSFEAAGDLSAKQWHWVTINASGQVAAAVEGGNAFGVLQDKPAAAGRAGRVAYGGRSKAVCGGSITAGAKVTCNADGETVAIGSGDDYQLGVALEDGVDGRIISVQIDKRGLS